MKKKVRAAANRSLKEPDLKEGVPAFVQQGGLYILMGTLLVGVVISGGYFSIAKMIFTGGLLVAGAWEFMVVVALREWRSLRSFALWAIAGIALFSIASHFWTLNTETTDREAALMLGLLAGIFVPRAQALRLGARTIQSLLNWMIYTAGFVALWGIITYLLRITPYVELVDGFLRVGSTFQYSNALSCFELMALPVTLAMHQTAAVKDRPLYAIVAAIEISSIILAFSRLGLVALAAVVVYFMITAWKRELLSHMVFTVVAGVLMAAAALVLGEAQYARAGIVVVALLGAGSWLLLRASLTERGGHLFKRAVQAAVVLAGVAVVAMVAISERAKLILRTRFVEGFAWSKMIPHRTDTWNAAWRAFQDKPVKGWGLGGFYEIFAAYETASPTRFAHNLVLEMAVDTGIIGAVMMAAFLAYIAALALLRIVTHTSLMTRALAIGAAVFIFYNMFDWEWYIPAITGWFMVTVAYLEGGWPQEEPEG